MGRKVFVTGGTGRLGRPLVAALRASGDEVWALVRDSEGERAMAELGATPVRGNFDDAEALRRGAEGAETLFHLAGGVRGPGRITADQLNRVGTERVLEVSLGIGELARFVYVSSAAVYGDRSNLWVEEDFEPSPNTLYGASKVAAEKAAIASGLPVVIARLGAVYGPGFPFAQVDRIRAGRAWLPGEGRNHVPIVQVDDAVAALALLGSKGEPGQVVHVADKSEPTLKEFYGEVHKMVGGKPVRFWSTWIPSYVQQGLARTNERVLSRLGQRPRFTPDALRLFTSSVRLKTDRLERLGFSWRWPDYVEGVRASFGSGS